MIVLLDRPVGSAPMQHLEPTFDAALAVMGKKWTAQDVARFYRRIEDRWLEFRELVKAEAVAFVNEEE